MIAIILATVLFVSFWMWVFSFPPRGFHHKAKYRVRYPDGEVSMRCHKATAEDYAEIFGGKVEKVK